MRKIHTLPIIPLDVEERERHLRLDNAAVKLIEDTLKKPIGDLGGSPSLHELTVMVWACLTHEDPDLTVEHVGTLIGPANLNYVTGQLLQTMRAHGIEEGEGEKNSGSPTG